MSGSSMFGHEGLRLLIRMKARGVLRSQLRRLKRPSSWIFLLLGLGLSSLWIGSIILSGSMRTGHAQPDWKVMFGSQVGLLVLLLLTIIGSFNHRGLYLPKEEIELCFAAPLSRSDLLRYRLLINQFKSLFAGLVFGIAAGARMHNAPFASLGVIVTMLTVPILGQGMAVLLGESENRLGKLAAKLPTRVLLRVMLGVFIFGAIAFFSSDNRVLAPLFDAGGGGAWSVERVAAIPIVHAVLWPFTPWAAMITAHTWSDFLPWFGFACGFWMVAFETVARLNVDFRELSLETSADIAKRLNRVRKGSFSAGQTSVTRVTIGWTVPWLFGRGPFGAVAWHKLASIIRKAQGTLTMSAFVILFITILSLAIERESTVKNLLGGSAFIAAIGTVYMCAILRFDFRSDLEIMDSIKAWPLHPAKLFLATILPEVVFVGGLLALVLLGRAAFMGVFHPALFGFIAFQPLVTFTFVAVDNAVFLFAPVRYTPGEDGALQNMGRSLVMMLLRILLVVVVVIVAGLPAFGVWALLSTGFETSRETALWGAGSVAWAGLAAVDFGLVVLGGMMLRRFDVARDRG